MYVKMGRKFELKRVPNFNGQICALYLPDKEHFKFNFPI